MDERQTGPHQTVSSEAPDNIVASFEIRPIGQGGGIVISFQIRTWYRQTYFLPEELVANMLEQYDHIRDAEDDAAESANIDFILRTLAGQGSPSA